MHLNKRLMLITLLVLPLFLLTYGLDMGNGAGPLSPLVSSTNTTNNQAGDCLYNPIQNKHITFTYDSISILHNPLSGWVMYLSANSDPSYFDKQVYVPELGKNVYVRDYASACYIRTGWKSLNPSDGVYAWDIPGNPIFELIKRAEELSIPIAFRVVVDGRDQRENTPQFVFDAGAQYWIENEAYPERKTPLAIDPVWRSYYEKFVIAFAERFNNPQTTAFIDAYGLGKWGEGHNVCYEQGNAISENTAQYKANTMEWITSLYAKHFTHVPLVINYHRHIGHPVSEGMVPDSDSEQLLQIAINNGYCLRHDAFGMNNEDWGYNSWDRSYASKWNYKLPILMEGGWIVGKHSYWIDLAGYRKDHPEDVRQGEFDASKEAHVNMMDFRIGAETESWFNTSFNLVQRFVSEGGYRLFPKKVAVPEKMYKDTSYSITHCWCNAGWGYLPNNLRQWDYKYKVAFALLDSQNKPVQIFVDHQCEPSHWIEGDTYQYKCTITPTLQKGRYTLALAIVDTIKNNEPGIELALEEPATPGGWTPISTVVVE